MSSKDSELLNAMKTLNSSITSLNTVMTTISGKMGNPENTADKLIGAAVRYFMVLNGIGSFLDDEFDDAPALMAGDLSDIIHVENDTYMAIGSSAPVGPGPNPIKGGIYEFEADGSEVTLWGDTLVSSDSLTLLTGSTNYSRYYLAALSAAATGAGGTWEVFLFDSDGTLLKEVNFDYTDKTPDAIVFDSVNDRILLYSKEASGIYSLNIDAATMTKVYNVPYVYYDIFSASYISDLGLILITVDADDVGSRPNDHAWFIYDPSNEIFIASGFYDMITAETETGYYFCYNSNLDTLTGWSGKNNATMYLHHCGLMFAQLTNMVGPNAYGSVSVDDDDGSLTVDGTVAVSSSALPTGAATSANQATMITALQLIDNLYGALHSVNTDELVVVQETAPSVQQAQQTIADTATQIGATRADRRAFIIQNADDDNTTWIGKSTVTTANGIELLPKQLIVLENFDGSSEEVYGICAAGKTADVRYLEMW